MAQLGSRQLTIAIEGNIASGKSTLLEYMQKSDQAQVIVEPVSRWQHVIDGEQGNLIDRMYKDPQRWAYLFQSYVLLTMMEAHDTPQTKDLRVMERSVFSARYCFIENLRKCDPPLIDALEYEVYQRWFDWLMEHKRPHVDLIVYLRTDPKICLERLKSRGRSEESSVSLTYLQTLHARYEDWLIHNPHQHGGNVPVLVLDGNRDYSSHEQLHAEFTHAIAGEIERNRQSKRFAASVGPTDTPISVPVGRPRNLFRDGSDSSSDGQESM